MTLSFGANYDIKMGSSGMTLVPSINASYRTAQEVSTNNLTIYSGSVTGTNGTFLQPVRRRLHHRLVQPRRPGS